MNVSTRTNLVKTLLVGALLGAMPIVLAQVAPPMMLNAPADARMFYQGSQNELILPPFKPKWPNTSTWSNLPDSSR